MKEAPSADLSVERRSRITIMDGEVVTFATSFSERPGAFGPIYDSQGPFQVSASRNAVIVHRAELTSAQDLAAFVKAVDLAGKAAQQMSCGDRGNFNG